MILWDLRIKCINHMARYSENYIKLGNGNYSYCLIFLIFLLFPSDSVLSFHLMDELWPSMELKVTPRFLKPVSGIGTLSCWLFLQSSAHSSCFASRAVIETDKPQFQLDLKQKCISAEDYRIQCHQALPAKVAETSFIPLLKSKFLFLTEVIKLYKSLAHPYGFWPSHCRPSNPHI